MLIKTSGYRLYDIDKGEVSNLWMPTKRGLDKPTDAYVKSLTWLRAFGAYVLEPGQFAGASGFSGGGGTNTFVMRFEGAIAGFTLTTAAETWYHGNTQSVRSDAAFYMAYEVCPVTCTMTAAHYMAIRTGAVGNPLAQAITHYIRNVSSTTDTTGVAGTWDSAAGTADKYSESASLAVTAGHHLVAKIVTPGWATSAPASPRYNAAGLFTV